MAANAQTFPRLAVSVALVRADGAILLIQRARAPYAGLWSLPGGGVEKGETLQAAAVREVHEETGLTVEERLLIPIGALELPGEKMPIALIIAFTAPAPDGEMILSDEAQAACWVKCEEAQNLPQTPDLMQLLRRASVIKL